MTLPFRHAVAIVSVFSFSATLPARAADVTLAGIVINSCVLTPATGTMVLDTSGTELGSESGVGGLAATMAVRASGATPELTFATPVSSVSGATAEIRYTHTGSPQSYTSGESNSTASLIDVYTIHGKLVKPTGFANGTHQLTTTVTCQQAGS